ncbi:FAD-dependent oxidoreductase [bacterium]|nr:FAD-dependent oxidoreductase [candidate division CSSED10-310 bacterium]
MAKIKIIVNGQKYVTDSDKTILQAVHDLKIDHIPTLCYESQLEPYNSCYVCVVEVKGQKNLAAACSTRVQDKMELFTRNRRVMEARRTALELLVSNHYADCLPPCTLRCPAGVDVQGYIALIAAGQPQAAIQVIKQTNPLPAVCGRVCTRPCELSCRRNLLDTKVGIDFLKRYAADVDLEKALRHYTPIREPDRAQSVAIIGAGPAGLSAAFFLRLRGFGVTLFEAMPEAGGMLRYGIPEYRLPFDVLDREIDTILEMGVVLKTNMALGDDFTIKSLFDQGFEAVFLGMGAWGSTKLGVTGQEIEGVLSGIKFLEQLGRNKKPEIYGKIVVVGGGNTAIDCARTSLRLNAEEVVLLYRRTRKEMPANEMEIDAAEHEGVKMHFLAAPTEVIASKGRVQALKCIRMELGEPDASGRRRPVPVGGSEFVLECDFVFAAIGQSPDLKVISSESNDMLPGNGELNFTRWGSIAVNEETFETDTDGVFAGGDMVTGAATAIEAIAAGRKAAHAIHSYLQGRKPEPEPYHFNSRKDDFNEVEQKDLRSTRKLDPRPMPELDVKERITNFNEVELGYTGEDALLETSRCLECGCDAVFECRLRKYASEYGVKLEKYAGEVNKYELDRSHPLIDLDPNKCILCGRCIRVCQQIVGASVFGFENRGFHTIVRPEMGRTLLETDCISCGMCVATCPTGAISERISMPKPGPWDMQKCRSVCSFCGVGCTLQFGAVADMIVKTVADDSGSPTHGNLCIMGRYGYRYINDSGRLLKPMIRRDGDLQDIDWTGAVRETSDVVKSVVTRYRGDEIAVFISPRLTNEEIYLIQKFSRVVLRTQNITSLTLSRPRLDSHHIASTATFHDIENAQSILITLAHLRRDHPVADFAVRKARNLGARVVYMGSEEDPMLKKWDLYLKLKPGTEYVAMLGLMKTKLEMEDAGAVSIEGFEAFSEAMAVLSPKVVSEITGIPWDRFQKAAVLLSEGNRPVFMCDRDYPGARVKTDLDVLSAAGDLFEAKLAVFTEHNNSQGLMDMGGLPGFYPGYQPVGDAAVIAKFQKGWCVSLDGVPDPADDILAVLKKKRIKALFVFGEDFTGLDENTGKWLKTLNDVPVKIVADLFRTPTVETADIVLPMNSAGETQGSYTSGLRTVSESVQAVNPRSGMEFWKVITEIAGRLGVRFKFNYESVDDIQSEIRSLVPTHRNIIFRDAAVPQIWALEQAPGIDMERGFKVEWIDTEPEIVRNPSRLKTNSIRTWFDNYLDQIGLKR